MITPSRIEVRNIRSVEHAIVEPLAEGVTSLAGHIGSGKTTLMNAVLWALYGEVGGIPGLLVQSEMRRKDCPEGDLVEASVDFTHEGADYRAVRRLRRSKSGKETASAEFWVDGVKQSQITPTKLTDKIVALTGLSGRAFAGAFFIPQGNLPALAEGTPSDVQRLIEEQTGLTELTRRVESARREAKDAQVIADAKPGSREELDAAQADVDAAQATGEQAWTAKEAAQARAEKARQVWESAQADHATIQQKDRAAREAHESLAAATARHDSATEQVQALSERAQKNPVIDVEDARAARAALRQAIADLDTAERNHQVAAARAEEATEAAQAAAARAQQMSDPSEAIAQAQARYDTAQARRGAAAGEWERLNRAVEALRATHPSDAECPTCSQHLPDPHALMGDLTGHQRTVEEDGRAAAVEMEAARNDVDALTRQRDAFAAAHSDARSAQEAAQSAAEAASGAAATHTKAQQALDAVVATHGAYTGDGERGGREAAQWGLDRASEALASHEHAVATREELAAWQEREKAAVGQIERLREAAADAPSREEVDSAAAAAAEARARLDEVSAAAAAASSEADVARQAVTSAEAHRDRAKSDVDAKIEAATRADTLRHAAAVLSALRTDLLADYTATISASATDLMQQVGGGSHTGVVIDQKFTPCVTLPDGTLRPTRALSGGEKMRAALCLRLGIADQITGSTGAGMIFADEITANHDEETTAAVVDLIRGLGRPMLIVAHASEVNQSANRVYSIAKRSEEAGTEVTLSGQPPRQPSTVQNVA